MWKEKYVLIPLKNSNYINNYESDFYNRIPLEKVEIINNNWSLYLNFWGLQNFDRWYEGIEIELTKEQEQKILEKLSLKLWKLTIE